MGEGGCGVAEGAAAQASQQVVDLRGGSFLKVTIAKWLTPKGVSISQMGLVPTIEVKTTEENIKNKVDPVLDRAVQYLKTGK